jgi:hypothetical protein
VATRVASITASFELRLHRTRQEAGARWAAVKSMEGYGIRSVCVCAGGVAAR